MTTEENYKVKERSENDVREYGSVKRAIECLKSELEGFESSWSKYSGDGLGHAITCTRLKIAYLERIS